MNINNFRKQQHTKIKLKLWKSDGEIKIYHSFKTRRIIAIIKAAKFLDSTLKAYIKVIYPYQLSGIQAYNDGSYTNQKEILQALKAFLEK